MRHHASNVGIELLACSMALLIAQNAQAQTLSATSTPADAAGFQTAQQPQQTASSRGVDVYGTLNPQAPTNATHAVTSDLAPGALNGAAAQGYNAGAVTFFPSVTGAVYYDDNVFALPFNRLSDFAFVLRPELAWRSNNWNNLDVGGSAYVEGRKYVRYSSEDQVNGGMFTGGTARLNANNEVVGNVQYQHGHEDRGVSTTISDQFITPIAFDQGQAAAALNSRFDRVWSSIGGAVLAVHYDNAALTNGVIASQAYRSGDIERIPFRVGYVIAPLTSVFFEISGNRRDFEVNLYDSYGYRTVAGLLLEPGQGARLRGEVYAGYMNQQYTGPTFAPVSTWTAGGSLAFLVTDQLTVTAEGRRDAREASLSGGVSLYTDGVSVIESVATTRADYRILPNVVIGGGASYIEDDYQTASRTDSAWSPFASAKYFVTPTVTLGFDYRYVTFQSTGFGIPAYDRNIYLASVNARF